MTKATMMVILLLETPEMISFMDLTLISQKYYLVGLATILCISELKELLVSEAMIRSTVMKVTIG